MFVLKFAFFIFWNIIHGENTHNYINIRGENMHNCINIRGENMQKLIFWENDYKKININKV